MSSPPRRRVRRRAGRSSEVPEGKEVRSPSFTHKFRCQTFAFGSMQSHSMESVANTSALRETSRCRYHDARGQNKASWEERERVETGKSRVTEEKREREKSSEPVVRQGGFGLAAAAAAAPLRGFVRSRSDESERLHSPQAALLHRGSLYM